MSKLSAKPLPKQNHVVRTGSRFAGWIAHPVAISLLLFVGTMAIFWQVVGFNYINCDDPEYFFSNPRVRYGFSWEQVKWAFSTVYFGNWLPLTWLSHMLDAQLFGTGPSGPHFTNLLMHAANAVLVFLLVRRLTGARWRSAVVAALFAWHPLHVESVAWVAERRDVLCAFFGLLSLLFYARYSQSKTASRQSPIADYMLTLFFFACGLMSKAMVVTLPFVMLLLDYWPLKRLGIGDWRLAIFRLVREKIPFFAMSAALSVVTFFAQQKAGAVPSLEQLTFWGRFANALVSYARYLGKTFWPVNLALPYPHPWHWPLQSVVAAGALVAVLCGLALWLGRKQPFVATGWFWFFGMLVPAIGLIQTGSQAMADRFTYLPHIGLFLVVVWGAWGIFNRWRLPAIIAGGATAIILAACALRTVNQLQHWRNSETLFRHALAVTKNNYPAHNGLGVELAAQRRLEEAMEQYRLALAIRPAYGQALNNLGNLLVRQNRFEEAIDCLEKALANNSNPAEVHNNLANALAGSGRVDEAIEHFQEALRLQPNYAEVYNNFGNALAMKGRTDEAIQQYRKAIHYHPDLTSARCNLGLLLVQQGKIAEAKAHYHAALKADPKCFEALNNLGIALTLEGQYAEALKCFESALPLAANPGQVYVNLGNVFIRQNRVDEAIACYRQAVQASPRLVEPHNYLGMALLQKGELNEAVEQFHETLRLNPDDPKANLNLGRALARLGRREEAISQLLRALRLPPVTAEAGEQLRAMGVQISH
jgi:Flp pilus assembly protein TadD